MQRMHQSYKYMKAQLKKLSGCASNLHDHEDLGHFEEAHHQNIQVKFYNENSHQYIKVITQETLYHEDHGATLKHKSGKRIVALTILSFSLFFFIWAFSFFMASFFFLFCFYFSSGVSSRLVGESQSPSSFPHLRQCSNYDDHHTFIFLQLNTQNKNMTLCDASGGVPGYAMNQELHV